MEQNKDKSQVDPAFNQEQNGESEAKTTPAEEETPSTDTPEAEATTDEANQPDSKETDELKQLKEQLGNSQEELADAKEQLVRLQAEFINFRKRKEKEMLDTVRFANEELIKHLLPIVDNFDRTLDAIEKTDNMSAIKDGIKIVDHSMKHQLERIGVTQIDCLNKKFDAQYHDAISIVPVEEEDKKGKVIDEVEKGYMLKDKVIRYSKVIVGE